MESGRHNENEVLLSDVASAAANGVSNIEMDQKSHSVQEIKSPNISTSDLETVPTWSSTGSSPLTSKLKVVKNKLSRMIHHFWMIEVVSSFISFLCLALIALVFWTYDGKKQELQGIYSGLPSATINILITIMRTATILPVGTALAQLQWSWFKTEQQLADMETFADATRGPFGSLILLSKMTQRRIWHFASIGAILTVLSLPLESVVIQALTVPMRGKRLPDSDINQSYIGVLRTNRYEWSLPSSNDASFGNRIPPPSITAAIDQGIAQASSYGDWWSGSLRTLNPNCTTGFCDYERYQSLDIMHYCDDVSLNVITEDRQYVLPANLGLEADLTLGLENGLINTTVSYLYPDSTWFKHASAIGPLIANIFILTSMLKEPVAIECALFWIVRDFRSRTTNGNWTEDINPIYMTENEVASPARQAAINPQAGQDIIMNAGDDCWINGTQRLSSAQDLDPTLKEDCAYIITASAQQGLQNWLKSRSYGLVGSLSSNLTASNNFIAVLDTLFRAWVIEWPYRRRKEMSISSFLIGKLDYDLFDPLTRSISSAVRMLPRGALYGRNTWGQLAAGIMYDSFRFRVLWPIMIFPAVLVVGAALFTALVAVRARDNLWKKSSLPFVFFGLGRRVGEYADMVEEARGIKVKLEMGEGKWSLVEVGGRDGDGSGN